MGNQGTNPGGRTVTVGAGCLAVTSRSWKPSLMICTCVVMLLEFHRKILGMRDTCSMHTYMADRQTDMVLLLLLCGGENSVKLSIREWDKIILDHTYIIHACTVHSTHCTCSTCICKCSCAISHACIHFTYLQCSLEGFLLVLVQRFPG